jgi:hypothetical protein
MRKILFLGLAFLCAVFLAVAISFYRYDGMYGVNTVLHGGPTRWLTMRGDDQRLPMEIEWALAGQPPEATSGPLAWRLIEPGLDVSELPVIARGRQVDDILLTRIDPAGFRFVLQNRASGDRDLAGWMSASKPVVLINGSYFSPGGQPDTPFLSEGRLISVRNDPAAQGAFVAGAASAVVEALTDGDWRDAFHGAGNALATYPLLIGPYGYNKAIQESHWVANRSFVGEDCNGRIILGTTKNAFFSLARFAMFLYSAPLGLKMALNLDGGPVACQAVDTPEYQRRFCGEWEIRDRGGWFKVLKMLPGSWIPLPVALLAYRK